MLNSIEDAIADIRAGKVVIVVDDEDRENEGDFICAARCATPEVVNFMATHGRGLVCAPLTEDRCEELGLELMVGRNTALHATPFTVSVDLLKNGVTTGISASDRSKTILALIDPATKPEELGRPGHIFPLKARKEGVLRRAGHTEAAVDLARLAGFEPAGVLVEILKEDGEMARVPDLEEVQRSNGAQHLALVKGDLSGAEPPLVRVHSSCVTGDIFGSCRCDCGPQLHRAMKQIDQAGRGVVVYMNQEGRGIGLLNKLRAYKLQEQGRDTVEANVELGFGMDERDYGVGASILRDLGISKMRLLTNNPRKRTGLMGYGLEIVETVPIEIEPNQHNQSYLTTKRDKLGHLILSEIHPAVTAVESAKES
jgi:3,4-dihydroxy 2-butanone 4-phosphate synthase/GTP cyclohydrolase II